MPELGIVHTFLDVLGKKIPSQHLSQGHDDPLEFRGRSLGDGLLDGFVCLCGHNEVDLEPSQLRPLSEEKSWDETNTMNKILAHECRPWFAFGWGLFWVQMAHNAICDEAFRGLVYRWGFEG